MTPQERKELQLIVATMADPKGNWKYAWESLCELAEMNSHKLRPPFKRHPLADVEDPPPKK